MLSYISACPSLLHLAHLTENIHQLNQLYVQFVPDNKRAPHHPQIRDVRGANPLNYRFF